MDVQEAALLAGARPPQMGSPEPWLPEPVAAWGTLTLAANPAEPTKLERTKVPTEVGDYRHYYASVRDAILDISPLVIPAEDAYRTIRLLELAVQSSEQKRTLAVDFNGVK
jgi:scyllo-inositol 2-dehydrogenase (NADP+)